MPSPFRSSYLGYEALTAQLKLWAETHPACTQLASLGRSAGGRELWLLTIGRELAVPRPAVWVDGNMHAGELCGSSVALAIAEDLLALHAGSVPAGLPAAAATALLDAHVYILPRMSPDGAEAVLTTGRYVRSSPVDERAHRGHAHWRAEDMDADGLVACMRQRTDDGELVALPEYPHVLVPRELGDTGPFYRVYPEGRIANYDGRHIPDPYFLADNQTDFNRNFPYSWAPEPTQAGAGDFPGSAPETRAVLAFASAHPNIYAWLNLHTFGGVVIRPLGDKPDSKMDRGDLALFRQLEAWMGEHTGYPTVSGFEEFCYEPEKPLRGDLTEYAYNQRGALAYVVELWDLFHRLGIPRQKPFVDHYMRMDREHLATLARWDADVNHSRIFRAWRPFRHPQLGDVELGGPDLRVGITNPPYELLDEVCRGQSAAFLRVAALLPHVRLELTRQEALGGGLTQVDVCVRNSGYLGTCGLPSAKQLPHVEPLRLTAAGPGLQVRAPVEATLDLGHLEGWGRGKHASSIFIPWSRGNGNERHVSFVVQGRGELTLTAGSCRVGQVCLTVAVG